MKIGKVWVLYVRVTVLQVVTELHGRVGGVGTLGAVVHLHALMFPRMENVLTDVFSTVGSREPNQEEETMKLFLSK